MAGGSCQFDYYASLIADYPSLLLNIPDPPPLLYYQGKARIAEFPHACHCGQPQCDTSGLANAEAFAEAASNAGLCIVSGMALGVDAAAHRGGLRGSAASIAVVGTGLDIVYPAGNRELAHEFAEKGALISEFPLGTPPLAAIFRAAIALSAA